jgi:sarcosine oxidase subunit beta
MPGNKHLADVVVIGGGIAGASASFHLANAGARVILLEKGRLAGATTGQSSAVVGAFYGAAAECRLALATLAELEHFTDEVGGDPGFHQVGLLELGGPADGAALSAAVELRTQAGASVELIDASAVAEAFPGLLADGVSVASFERRAGYVDPVALTRAYAAAAERRGADVVERRAATTLVVDHGRVVGVDTVSGRIRCDAVVVANGIAAVSLLAPLGLDFGLTPRPVQYARFTAASPLRPELPAVLDDSQAFWFRADGDEIVSGLEFVPTGPLSDAATRDYAALCQRKLRRRLAAGTPLSSSRYGTMTVGMSPDGRPIADRVEGVEGLFVMVGDSGISLKFAPISGRCLAEWYVTGAPRSADISTFSAGRLRGGPKHTVTLRPGGHRRTVHLLRELSAVTAESLE